MRRLIAMMYYENIDGLMQKPSQTNKESKRTWKVVVWPGRKEKFIKPKSNT